MTDDIHTEAAATDTHRAQRLAFERRRLDAEHARITAELEQLPTVMPSEGFERLQIRITRYEEHADAFARRLAGGNRT